MEPKSIPEMNAELYTPVLAYELMPETPRFRPTAIWNKFDYAMALPPLAFQSKFVHSGALKKGGGVTAFHIRNATGNPGKTCDIVAEDRRRFVAEVDVTDLVDELRMLAVEAGQPPVSAGPLRLGPWKTSLKQLQLAARSLMTLKPLLGDDAFAAKAAELTNRTIDVVHRMRLRLSDAVREYEGGEAAKRPESDEA